MPYTIAKEYRFAAAHSIPGHPGKCARLHGHNYRVRLLVEAATLDGLGMVVDFADVKALLDEVCGPWDHRVLNEIPPFDRRSPSAEAIAEVVYLAAAARLDDGRVRVRRVEVWESDGAAALYEP